MSNRSCCFCLFIVTELFFVFVAVYNRVESLGVTVGISGSSFEKFNITTRAGLNTFLIILFVLLTLQLVQILLRQITRTLYLSSDVKSDLRSLLWLYYWIISAWFGLPRHNTPSFIFQGKVWTSSIRFDLIFHQIRQWSNRRSHLDLLALFKHRVTLTYLVFNHGHFIVSLTLSKGPGGIATSTKKCIGLLSKLSDRQSNREPKITPFFSGNWSKCIGGGFSLLDWLVNCSLAVAVFNGTSVLIESLVTHFSVPWKIGSQGCRKLHY